MSKALTMDELKARQAILEQQLKLLEPLGSDPIGKGMMNERKVELGRITRQIEDKQALEYREVIKVDPSVGTAVIEKKRTLAAVEVIDADTFLPYGPHMPNVLLTSGIITGQSRNTLTRYFSSAPTRPGQERGDPSWANEDFPLNGRNPNEYARYSGPVMAREDRDVLRALMAIASKHALGSDDADVPTGYITVTARELMNTIGVRNFGTKTRRSIIESVMRWSQAQLAIVEYPPGARKATDFTRLTNVTRLINLSQITRDLGANAAEITFAVPRSAAKLYGYQDFCKVPSYYDYPPLVSFLLDYLAPHKAGYAVKASTLWTACLSQATYQNFVAKILYEALGWLVAEGYVVELRAIEDERLAMQGIESKGLQFRITRPTPVPVYDKRAETRKKKRGEWYRYMPRQRRTKAEMAAANTMPTLNS